MKRLIAFSLSSITAILLIPAVSFAQGGLPAGYVETMSNGEYTTDTGAGAQGTLPAGFVETMSNGEYTSNADGTVTKTLQAPTTPSTRSGTTDVPTRSGTTDSKIDATFSNPIKAT
ncbi:MAG: hypothetical protein WC767_03595, partial [Candidatus Paceibacterota bacterium]